MARRFIDEDGNEIDPETLGVWVEEEEDVTEGLNRADVGIILALPWVGLANGIAAGVNYFHEALANLSQKIDARKRFQREAGLSIEALIEGE